MSILRNSSGENGPRRRRMGMIGTTELPNVVGVLADFTLWNANQLFLHAIGPGRI